MRYNKEILKLEGTHKNNYRFRILAIICILCIVLADVQMVSYAENQTVEKANYTTGVSTTSELQSRLSNLIAKYQNTYWTSTGYACASHSSTCYSKYYYGWQCNGFANYIFNDLFCGGFIGQYDSNKYYIPIPNGATLIGKSWGFSSTDTATVKSILSQGKPGDYIQVRRRDKTYGHSMILVSVDENGVYLFDCNSDGKCGVKYYYQTWATFASKNVGMSLYHSTRYPADGSVTCSCSTAYAGNYTCTTTTADLSIRNGHGTTGTSIIGSIPSGATVYVSKASGTGTNDWAHVEYNGISGYASMQYLQKQSDNQIAPKLNSWISFEKMGEEASDITQGDLIYLCYRMYDGNSDKNLDDLLDRDYTVKETIYKPDGTVAHTVTYTNDNNWIGISCDIAGTYSYEVAISGDLTGTETGTFTVKEKAEEIAPKFESWISFETMGTEASDITQGDSIYLCYRMYDGNSDKNLDDVESRNYTVKETIYKPDGTVANTVTYTNDNNWIGISCDVAGTYSYEVAVAGEWGNGTEAGTFTVKENPKEIHASTDSVSLTLGETESIDLYVWTSGYHDATTTLSYANSNSNISCKWGEWGADNRVPLTITALKEGTTTITLSVKDKESNVVLDTYTVSVTISTKKYDVSYNANGGTGAPSAQAKSHGIALVLSDITPTRSGYKFLGWATSATATTAQYTSGAYYRTNADVVLYAVWEKEIITVSEISVSSLPSKTSYKVGDSFDASGLELLVTYSNGTTKSVSSGYSTSGFDATTAGTKTITVTYEGQKTAFTIKVEEPVPETNAQIVIESKNATPGETVSVNVLVKNNPGIASMKLKVSYDDILTLTGITYNTAIGGQFQQPQNMTSPVVLNWFNGASDSTGDWVFATLTFVVSENAERGATADITVSYNADDVYNIAEENVSFTVVKGAIEVANYVPGDINEDGNVNNRDLTRLFQYLSDWQVEVNQSALDVNGDGNINNRDLTRLFQYLSDWDVEVY